jgi:hypothetical protein
MTHKLRFDMTPTQSRSALYPSHNTDEKKIWACLLTNEDYLRGVLTLYYSLVTSAKLKSVNSGEFGEFG